MILRTDGSLLVEVTPGASSGDRLFPFSDSRGLNIPIPVEPGSRDANEKIVGIISSFVRECLNGDMSGSGLETLSQRIYQSVGGIRASVEAEGGSQERDRVWAKAILASDQRTVSDAEFEAAVLALKNLSESGDTQATDALSKFVPAIEALRKRARGQSQ